MNLISFMPDKNSLKEFKTFKNRLHKLKIDGIETIVGDYCPIEIFHSLPIKGIHIIYFPTWMNIMKKAELITCFKEQFQIAKDLNAEYVVFHVSHVTGRDIFRFEYDYTDEEVIENSLEIINEVFTGDGPLLLFENLPWPGLNFNDYALTKYFLEKVNYKNKGLLIDLSHMICLNKKLENFDDAAEEILSKLSNLKELKNYIHGVHINGSLSKKYLSQDFSSLLKEWEMTSESEKYFIEVPHMQSIDTHAVFASKKIQNIFRELPLKYKTFELRATSLGDLLDKVEKQLQYIHSKE